MHIHTYYCLLFRSRLSLSQREMAHLTFSHQHLPSCSVCSRIKLKQNMRFVFLDGEKHIFGGHVFDLYKETNLFSLSQKVNIASFKEGKILT